MGLYDSGVAKFLFVYGVELSGNVSRLAPCERGTDLLPRVHCDRDYLYILPIMIYEPHFVPTIAIFFLMFMAFLTMYAALWSLWLLWMMACYAVRPFYQVICKIMHI